MKTRAGWIGLCAGGLAGGVWCAAAMGQGSLVGLGSGTDLEGVSGDGLVAVGGTSSGAIRWTAGGGIQALGNVGGLTSGAFAASADGGVIVGSLEGGVAHPFRWTASGGMVDIGTPNGDTVTRAMSCSNDGAALAGNSNSGSFRWTTATGFTTFPGAGYGISGDGTVVVGGAFQNGGSHAYRWTVGGGMQDLGVLPGGPLSVAYALSRDGLVVVGMSYAGPTSPVDYRPFRWTSGTGMVNLGLLPGAQYGWATAASGDGSVVVGEMWMGSEYRAFIWTAAGGMRELVAELAAAGANTSGWALWIPTGVSGDGRVIVGNGVGPGGYQGFVGRLGAGGGACYANCDGSTTAPVLNVQDFSCFLTRFASGDAYANCDASTTAPVLNVADFSCFLVRFAAGCP